MSTISAYFIPVKQFKVGEFKQIVKDILEKLQLIDGLFDEYDETYSPGSAIEFEYASIHDTEKIKLIPEASSAGYGTTCPQCNADMDDELYNILNDYYDYESETGKEKDMNLLNITCPDCKKVMPLQEVTFTQPVLLAHHYFKFVDTNEEIPAGLIAQLEASLQSEIKVIYEKM